MKGVECCGPPKHKNKGLFEYGSWSGAVVLPMPGNIRVKIKGLGLKTQDLQGMLLRCQAVRPRNRGLGGLGIVGCFCEHAQATTQMSTNHKGEPCIQLLGSSGNPTSTQA